MAGGSDGPPAKYWNYIMKPQTLVLAVAACAVAVLFVGCGKMDKTAAPSAAEMQPAAADKTAPSVKQTADELAQKASSASEAAQKAASELSEKASAEAQSLIDQAKKLISENKFTEAGEMLSKLTQFKLTPDQEAILDNMKQQHQKLVQDAAAKGATSEGAKTFDGSLKK